MDGYRVVTVDDERIGRVVGMQGDYYIVESGSALRKSRYPLPKRYASVDREYECVRAQLSKETLCGGPRIGRDGRVDETELDAYYPR